MKSTRNPIVRTIAKHQYNGFVWGILWFIASFSTCVILVMS